MKIGRIASWFVGLVAGLVFGVGLAMSDMVNPARVLGFLDVFGDWDATLLFVMLGAVAVTAPFTYWIKKRGQTAFGESLDLPKNNTIDGRLIAGAVLFGIGWGLVGLCPGPAIASVSLAWEVTWPFLIAMVVGSFAYTLTNRSSSGGLRPRKSDSK